MEQSLKTTLLPAFDDNYIFIIEDTKHGTCGVIDAGDPQPVLDYLKTHNKKLDFIFNTHHHHDHVGGNTTLKKATNCQIVGAKSDSSRIPEIDIELEDGDHFQFGAHTFQVLETPGHTIGHICYFCETNKDPVLFCGDTLFAMGCGRLLEGSAKDLFKSLEKIKTLPTNTRIYCAHEYTYNNGLFALDVSPNNQNILQRMEHVKTLRLENIPTIPSSL